MMGGSETVSGDKDGVHATAIHVPIGWQRRMEGGQVIYVSPSGTALCSLDEVKTYLLTDGTCKCGLECPLIVNKVFSFTVGVKVEQHSQPIGKAEQDMTKLCNHRRKVVAMAALCRSMQASQLPFANLHHPEVSGAVDSRNPKRVLVDREEDDHSVYHSKLHPVPARTRSHLHVNPSASPKSSPHQFIYPNNGSSPVLHAGTHSNHPLDALRRLQHAPPIPASSSPSSTSCFPAYSTAQRSPLQTHLPHGVIVGGSPLSPSPSLSPSVHNMNCVSPRQRSRHPSASPSPLSDQGGGLTAAGGGPMGSNMSQRRKSTSSSPGSPLPGGSPNPSPHFPKYKLEDLLEQFKNSGNSSTNNHHLLLPANLSSLTNQSSSNPNAPPSKASKSPMSPISPSPLGPFLSHHHRHQGKLSHPTSFPASSLLSAAAKAQLANQITHGQSSKGPSNLVSLPSSLEVLQDGQQQQHSSKVTNSTLHSSHPPSFKASTRPPHPSLAEASSVLFPPSQSLASSLPNLPPTTERNASHRKRQRRSPTVLSMLRDTQQLANGLQKTPPGDGSSATNAAVLENHHHHHHLSGPTPRLPVSRQVAHLPRPPRQTEDLDFTTGLPPTPLGLDPPTQPLSALLRLLSVQNAQAAASASNSAQPGPVALEGGGHTNKQSPRRSPSSPASHSTARQPQTRSPCPTSNTNPLASALRPLSPPPTSPRFRSVQSPTRPLSSKSSPLLRHSAGSTTLPNSNLALHNSCSPFQHAFQTPDKQQLTENRALTMESVSQERSCVDPQISMVTKQHPVATSPGDNPSHHPPSAVGDAPSPLPLAEAFPFMNQEQLLQLLSSTGGLPSLLDPTVLASLPLGGLWLGGQHAQLPPATAPQPPQTLLNSSSLFPLLPLLTGAQGELPLNLLGLLNPLPHPASTPSPGQEADLGLNDKPSLQALIMASWLLGQQHAPLLPLSGLGQLSQVSLEVPLQQPQHITTTLEGLTLDKASGLLDPSSLSVAGLLEVAQGLLPIPPGAEGAIQALQSLLLPGALPSSPRSLPAPQPALLSAALRFCRAQPVSHPQLASAQLIFFFLFFFTFFLQLNLAPPSEGDKPMSLQETQNPAPQEDIPASQTAPQGEPSPDPVSSPAHERSPPPQRVSEGRSVIDPYTSFMDTIYTSFLQVSAKEQEGRAHMGPSDPTSPFCASAPVSLSPRRACSLHNTDLSRLSLEAAAAHSPAQGTPKPTEGESTSPLQRKPLMVEGHGHPQPPLPSMYFEEAKTDCTGPAAAVCPYVEAEVDRQGHLPHAGYLSPRDGCSGRPNEEAAGTLLRPEQERVTGGARRGRKRKQT
uniref:MBD domain-containing protein n=1 Tax=Gasterosteus aculeatus aculeatus TaxID=481459 RepID=A0AAQ4NS19_GASAC